MDDHKLAGKTVIVLRHTYFHELTGTFSAFAEKQIDALVEKLSGIINPENVCDVVTSWHNRAAALGVRLSAACGRRLLFTTPYLDISGKEDAEVDKAVSTIFSFATQPFVVVITHDKAPKAIAEKILKISGGVPPDDLPDVDYGNGYCVSCDNKSMELLFPVETK